jgi:hypothetical protein
VGKPGKKNKLFFFYAHEFRPQTLQINSGNVIRLRVPTQLERAGDFSQTRDQNGNLLTSIYDASTGTPNGYLQHSGGHGLAEQPVPFRRHPEPDPAAAEERRLRRRNRRPKYAQPSTAAPRQFLSWSAICVSRPEWEVTIRNARGRGVMPQHDASSPFQVAERQ